MDKELEKAIELIASFLEDRGTNFICFYREAQGDLETAQRRAGMTKEALEDMLKSNLSGFVKRED